MPDPGKGEGNRATGNDRDPRNLDQVHVRTLEREGDCAGDSLGHEWIMRPKPYQFVNVR